MASQYPATIDNTITLPTASDSITPVSGASVNLLRDAIIRIETELGIKPSSVYGTVRNRIDYLESITTSGGGGGGGTNFVAGGDLSGSATFQTVIGLHGVSVSSTAPTTNQVLLFNGTNWIPSVIPVQTATGTAGGDLSGTYPNPTVAKIQGHSISPTTPTSGQYLVYNSSGNWTPTTVAPVSSVTMAGDITGSSSANTLSKLAGTTLTISGLVSGQVLEYNGTAWINATAPSGFTAGGDLTGTSTNQTVAKLQGSPVSPTTPTTGQLLTWGSTGTWSPATYVPSISDTNVVSNAAIAGTKITPNFGTQSVISGVSLIAPSIAFSTTGGPNITSGTGVPSTAPSSGSLYVRSDGYSETSLYSYDSGSWNAIGGIKIHSVITANYTITSADQFLPINTSSGAFTITFPTSPVSGQRFTINDVAGSLSTNNCTLSSSITILSPTSGPTNTIILNQNGFSGSFIYNGSTWSVSALVQSTSGGSTTPSGPANGDLSGSYPNPTVNKIQGIGVSNTAPATNQFFIASSSTNWQPATLSRDLSTSGLGVGQVSVVGIQGNTVPTPSGTGTYLEWTGSAFAWNTPAGGGGGSPTGSAGGDLGSTYPNPTVVGLQGHALPAPSTVNTYLEYTSSGLTWSTVSGGGGGSATPVVKNANYNLLSTDGDVFADLSGGAWTLTLLASPSTGEKHAIKDYMGYAASNPLTISGNGKLIEQWSGGTASTLVISQGYDSATIEFNGTFWSII